MSQGQERSNRRYSAAGLAWSVSIVVHAAVLGVFGIVKFSQWHESERPRATPIAQVGQIRKIIESEPVIPKPKVKKTVASRSEGDAIDRRLPVGQVFDVPKLILRSGQNVSGIAENTPKAMMPLSSSVIVSPKVEFFGSVTEDRKICYVVDCSGSMHGIFSRVQRELTESIENLEADRYFYVVFFGSDKLYEYGDGRLMRATPQTKSAVCGFIEAMRPAGTTNAMAALERAMRIRDSAGSAPAVIYFLTDGFELTSDSAYKFAQQVMDARKSLASTTKINTIGFWVQGWDGRILEKIAKQSGGECTLIND